MGTTPANLDITPHVFALDFERLPRDLGLTVIVLATAHLLLQTPLNLWALRPMARRFLVEPHFPEGFELLRPLPLRDIPVARARDSGDGSKPYCSSRPP
jgi:hypothetical protein